MVPRERCSRPVVDEGFLYAKKCIKNKEDMGYVDKQNLLFDNTDLLSE